MTEDFSPIKVTACDENRVRKASGSKTRYVVPFLLSSKPPRDWEDIFDDVWRAYRKSSSKPKAQAYIRRGEVVLECALSDVKQVFPNVRILMDAANEKFLSQLAQRAEKDEKKRRKREEEKLAEKQAIREALEGLEFS
ncbi:MAG TPA: hypothetical protein VKN18_01845 [Blastocatellia bacterium]|nr:hypothetical protein [Blastocatellia bacterium]